MTDVELAQFIKTLFFTYDRTLVPKDLKEYCVAWGPYVKEFDYDTCQQLLPNICMGKEFIPRPWEVRVAIINHTQSITPPPTPQQAWAQYQEIMAAVTSGAPADVQMHDVLVGVLKALGPSGMNNQFDAKRFEELYKDKANQWMKKTYWVGS